MSRAELIHLLMASVEIGRQVELERVWRTDRRKVAWTSQSLLPGHIERRRAA